MMCDATMSCVILSLCCWFGVWSSAAPCAWVGHRAQYLHTIMRYLHVICILYWNWLWAPNWVRLGAGACKWMQQIPEMARMNLGGTAEPDIIRHFVIPSSYSPLFIIHQSIISFFVFMI